MQKKSSDVLFAGPSLTAEGIALIEKTGIILRPPVQRNDIFSLLAQSFRGRIVIADGVFQQVMAVGHVEIRQAVETGLTVYGLCSMGAIRAYEMRDAGVIGFGQVYERFFQVEDFQDDELALLHDDVFPYLKVSEPLIHFRVCTERLVEEQKMTAGQADLVINHLKSLYFGERTMYLFGELIKAHTGFTLGELVPDFNIFRIKSLDLEKFLLTLAMGKL